MVKHQRRSHQRGSHAHELDDSMSETGSEDSPATPKNHAEMAWPTPPMMDQHAHQLQRAPSFHYSQSMSQSMNQPPMNYTLEQQYNHRHSLSSGVPPAYHGPPHSQAPLHSHGQPQQEQQLVHRQSSLPHHNTYFIPEENNPGVATMTTNPHAVAQHIQYQQMPRQVVDRPPLEIPYSNAPEMTASIQSSPGSFSTGSVRSPSHDGFYTHAPPAQTPAYALHATSPAEQQQQQQRHHEMVVAFQNHLPPSQAAVVEVAQIMTQSAAAQPMQQQQQQQQQSATGPQQGSPEQYQQHQQPHEQTAEEQQWYSAVEYQAPVEVTTIGSIPAYGQGMFDPWGPKIEFEDPSMQLPSARIAGM